MVGHHLRKPLLSILKLLARRHADMDAWVLVEGSGRSTDMHLIQWMNLEGIAVAAPFGERIVGIEAGQVFVGHIVKEALCGLLLVIVVINHRLILAARQSHQQCCQ